MALALSATPAAAQDLRLLTAGKVASFRDAPGTARDRATLRFRGDRELATLEDPRCPTASTLQLAWYPATETGVVYAPEIALPCANWRALGDGYVYRDRAASAGGVVRVAYTHEALRVRLRGPNYHPLRGPVAYLEMWLQIGEEKRFLARFHELRRNEADRVVTRRPSAPGADGEAAFWDTLWGDAPRSAEALALLEEAVALDVNDGRSQFLLGMLHLYLYGRNVTDPSAISELAKGHARAGREALDAAAALLWDGEKGDSRVPGFAAAAAYQDSFAHGDAAGVARALERLDAVIEINPVFNAFDYFVVPATVAGDDPLYARAVELVDEALSTQVACVVDQPELCGNAGVAPQNTAGALILFGDIYAKAGLGQDAVTWYTLGRNLGAQSGWAFQAIAEDRVQNLDARLALYENADPSDDPPLIGAGAEACVFCHYK